MARDPMFKRTTRTEYTLEPTDEHGDILDPLHFDTLGQATNAIPAAFADFPNAVCVDLAIVKRRGSEAEGEIERVYDYKLRQFRDGSFVLLTTLSDGLTPALAV